jgi:hypothetical protein
VYEISKDNKNIILKDASNRKKPIWKVSETGQDR